MPIIEAVDLTKTYEDGDTKTFALRSVSLRIEKEEFVAIMGPSGSGKSTLLHMLGFLDKQTSGTYRFDGKAIDDYARDEIARVRNEKMGFVFQAFNLLPHTTVFDNVKLPLLYSKIKESEWNDRAKEVIEKVGLSHRINHWSAQLSGGEKQRVAIARALVNDPLVIFADEPTGNLDSKSGGAVMELLQKLNSDEKCTIVLITHETPLAECAKRIVLMRDGAIESDRVVEKRRDGNHFTK